MFKAAQKVLCPRLLHSAFIRFMMIRMKLHILTNVLRFCHFASLVPRHGVPANRV